MSKFVGHVVCTALCDRPMHKKRDGHDSRDTTKTCPGATIRCWCALALQRTSRAAQRNGNVSTQTPQDTPRTTRRAADDQSQDMPQGKLAGCTVLQTDVTLNYTTHYLSWGMTPSSAASLTTTIIPARALYTTRSKLQHHIMVYDVQLAYKCKLTSVYI